MAAAPKKPNFLISSHRSTIYLKDRIIDSFLIFLCSGKIIGNWKTGKFDVSEELYNDGIKRIKFNSNICCSFVLKYNSRVS